MATSKNPSSVEGLGLSWWITFVFADRQWLTRRENTDALIDFAAATPWWAQADVLGRNAENGTPRGSVDEVKKKVATGQRELFVFAKGEPRAAARIDLTDASLSLEIRPVTMEIKLRARNEVLQTMGPSTLSAVIDALIVLRDGWLGQAALVNAYAEPFAAVPLTYPRVRPPRYSDRPVAAIADVVDTRFKPTEDVDIVRLEQAKAIAAAPVPAGVDRREHDGLVALRWVDDPSNAAEVLSAAAHHEQWLARVITTQPANGWNEHGDRHVRPGGPPNPPFFAYDENEQVGHATVDENGWNAGLEVARLKKTEDGKPVREVRLVAPTRDEAMKLLPKARAAKVRLLYGKPPALWDPDPPGPFLTPTS